MIKISRPSLSSNIIEITDSISNTKVSINGEDLFIRIFEYAEDIYNPTVKKLKIEYINRFNNHALITTGMENIDPTSYLYNSDIYIFASDLITTLTPLSVLPIASSTVLGAIKVGTSLSIDIDGVLDVATGSLLNNASNGLSLSGATVELGGNLTKNTTIDGLLNYSITYKDLSSLNISTVGDINNIINTATKTFNIKTYHATSDNTAQLATSLLTQKRLYNFPDASGTLQLASTTLSGYGILVGDTLFDTKYAPLSNPTFTGTVTADTISVQTINTKTVTTDFNLATNSTTGNVNISTNSLFTGILNIGTGAISNGSTKTINIGTSGLIGSATVINIGSSSGGASTVNINSNIFTGVVNATQFIKTGGLVTEFLKADGSSDSTSYTPSSRTLTINGTTLDLTTNRTFTVGDVLTSGSYANPTWITSLAWNKIIVTPTTLSGYGVLVGDTLFDTKYARLSVANVFTNTLTATQFIKTGGLATEFLKANGSSDSTSYTPSARTLSINGTTLDLSANRTFTVGDVLTSGSYANPSWITSLAWTKITSTPTTLTGYGILSTDTLFDTKYARLSVANVFTNTLTATQFIKTSGLATEFLKADGSSDSTSYTPISRTLTINGTTLDLTVNRTFTVGDVLTSGSYANPTWITSLAWSKITSTPTTLSGYGVLVGDTLFDTKYARLSVANVFTSTLTATQFIKTSGLSTEFLKADGSSDSTSYTPTSRTLTINGTALDLTANRTFTVGDVLTSSSYANPTWITSLAWTKITSTPTTLTGYGVLVGDTLFDTKYAPLSNPTFTGTVTSDTISTQTIDTKTITTDFNLATNSTTGNVNISTNALFTGLLNIGTGATASGSTKTINIGTGGLSGSTTLINIGTTGTGGTTINLASNALNTLSVPSTILAPSSSTSVNLFQNMTTASISFGILMTSGIISMATSASFVGIINIATGATLSGTTKTINIGTSGLSGSITNINIGSVISGSTGTIQFGASIVRLGTAQLQGGGISTAVTLFSDTQTNTITLGANLTTGGLNIANGTSLNGTINIASGATSAGTKTINIGTNSTAGSTTVINIGSSSGGTSTVNINSNIFTGNVNATQFIKTSGLATEFLKADGSSDSTSYTPSARTLTINGTTLDLTANRTFTVGDITLGSNGITKTGTTLKLGGTLIENTTISGDSTHNLILNNLVNADLISTNLTLRGNTSVLLQSNNNNISLDEVTGKNFYNAVTNHNFNTQVVCNNKISVLSEILFDKKLLTYYSATTTTNTPLVIYSKVLLNNSTSLFQIEVSCVRNTSSPSGVIGEANKWLRTFSAKNVSNVGTLGTIQSDFTFRDDNGLLLNISITGVTVEITVTGRTNQNIDWYVNVNDTTLSF